MKKFKISEIEFSIQEIDQTDQQMMEQYFENGNVRFNGSLRLIPKELRMQFYEAMAKKKNIYLVIEDV